MRVLLGALALATGCAAQEVRCVGAAMTGVHVYLDRAGAPVRARVQCEGEWKGWAQVGAGGGAPAAQAGAQCEPGEAVVALHAGAGAGNGLVVECARPAATHLRFARRSLLGCGRGQLAHGVSFEPDALALALAEARGVVADELGGDAMAAEDAGALPLGLLCRSTWLIDADGDMDAAVDLALDGVADRSRRAAAALARGAAAVWASGTGRAVAGTLDEARGWLDDGANPLARALDTAVRALAAAAAVGARAAALAVGAVAPAAKMAAVLLRRALRKLLAHGDLFVRAYAMALRVGRRLSAVIWRHTGGRLQARAHSGGMARASDAAVDRTLDEMAQVADDGEEIVARAYAPRAASRSYPDDDDDDRLASHPYTPQRTPQAVPQQQRMRAHDDDDDDDDDDAQFDVDAQLRAQLAAAKARYGMR